MTLLEAINTGEYITCRTKAEVAQLSKVADSLGYEWSNGESFLTLNYNSRMEYTGQISYRVKSGKYDLGPRCDAIIFSELVDTLDIASIYE